MPTKNDCKGNNSPLKRDRFLGVFFDTLCIYNDRAGAPEVGQEGGEGCGIIWLFAFKKYSLLLLASTNLHPTFNDPFLSGR